MSVSHGHSTMGGIEYDDGGCVEKIKKEGPKKGAMLLSFFHACASK